MTQIILINGPKGVGKDTAALAMKREGWIIAPIMAEAKLRTLDNWNVDRSLLGVFDSLKDQPFDEFGGQSFRQAIINYANGQRRENPKFFAENWAERLGDWYADKMPVVLVPDVRFFEEFIAACDLVGGKNVYLLRVFRPGHGWEGDVGGYIRTDLAVFGNGEASIQNDQDEDFFKLEAKVMAWGWQSRASK